MTPPLLWPTSRVRAIAVSAVVGIAYAAVIAVVRVVATTSFGSALFNPAIGVAAVGALWCLRRGWAPSWLLALGVVGGEWLGWLGGAPVGGTLVISVAHGAEVLVIVEAVVWLIQRLQLQTPEPRALVVTVVPASAGATVALIAVITSAKALGYQPDLWNLAGHTWLGDFLGVLVVLPAFLTANRLSWRPPGATILAESLIAGFLLAGAITSILVSARISHSFPASFVVIWIAVQFGTGPTSVAILAVASAVSLSNSIDHGPFAGVSSFAWASAFIGSLSVTGLMVSLLSAQRGQALSQALQAQRDLERTIIHDELTGLFTRPQLERMTAEEIASRPVGQDWLALISIDLDDFASINVRYGRSAADEAIRQIARRLQANVPVARCVARIGGDEYGLLFTHMQRETEAIAIGEQLRELVSVPVVVGEVQFEVTASVGVAVTNDGDPDQLMRDAEASLHDAKERGRNRLEVRTLRDRERSVHEQKLINRFPRALAEREFGCVYQPIVSLRDASHGVEVLARWFHPELGLLLPGDFLPILQRAGVMGQLSDQLFDVAIRQLNRWDAGGPSSAPSWLSINISAHELIDLRLPRRIRRILDASGVLPNRLMVEITEETMVSFTHDVRAQLEELRAMGVRIAVDDFGTGFSGLSYLTQLPIDVLKVDRQFLVASADSRTQTLLRSVCALARDLGIMTIVEGVETSEELDLVRTFGADAAQGWYLGRPTDADKLLIAMPEGTTIGVTQGGEGGI